MIKYGNVDLIQPTKEVLEYIQQRIPIEQILEFHAPYYTGCARDWRPLESSPQRQIQLGRLYWPRGASRWGFGHFLASEKQLDDIRKVVYVSASQPNNPQKLTISDGVNSISPYMSMLPPRPLTQWAEDLLSMYLVTFVDMRYWWWNRGAQIIITKDVTTWNDVLTAIRNGIRSGTEDSTIAFPFIGDDVDPAYLKPSEDLQCNYDYLPQMLDAVCESIGQRIILRLDGTTVVHQSAMTAYQNNLSNLGGLANKGRKKMFGGDFNFRSTSGTSGTSGSPLPVPTRSDVPPLVPSQVRVVFPSILVNTAGDPHSMCFSRCRTGLQTYTKTLIASGAAAYYKKPVSIGTKVIRSTALAWLNAGGTVINDAELKALTHRIATDWYIWQLAADHRIMPGIVAWDADAMPDYLEFEAYPSLQTRIIRETINNLNQWQFHQSSRSSSGCWGYFGDYNFADVLNFDPNKLQLFGHSSGCARWFDVVQCSSSA